MKPNLALYNQDFVQAFFQKRPLLKALFEKKGMQTLHKYATEIFISHIVSPAESRQKDFIATFRKLVTERVGEQIANEVAAQLGKYYVVSTADHHSPLGPAFSLDSNLIATSAYGEIADPVLKYMIVLSCSSVSLSNDHFPRGLFFQVERNGKFELERLSILPSNSHSSAVYHFRSYFPAEIVKVKKSLKEKVRGGLVSQHHAAIIEEILEEVYNRPEIFESRDYCDQITKTNLFLWRKIFSTDMFSPPDLLYLEQETVVAQLLLDYHIYHDTLLHRMIFDPAYAESFLEPLEKAMNLFVRQGFQVTDLFWGISADKHQRFRLNRQGHELVSNDGLWRVSLEPDVLAEALRSHTIVPNLLVVFTVLCLYYQLNCLGGFNQMHYLEAMQKTYNQLGMDDLPSTANPSLFDYGLRPIVISSGEAVGLATGMDLPLYRGFDAWHGIQKELQNITFAEALSVSLPEFSNIIAERED